MSLAPIALGSFVVYQTQTIAETQSAAQIAPRLFPYIIGSGLTICGGVLGWEAIAGGWRHVPLDEANDAPDWVAFLVISTGIILQMALIGWGGFIIASALLFVLITRGFSSRKPVRDVIIGVVLCTAVFFLFTVGLGLKLPAGPFGGA